MGTKEVHTSPHVLSQVFKSPFQSFTFHASFMFLVFPNQPKCVRCIKRAFDSSRQLTSHLAKSEVCDFDYSEQLVRRRPTWRSPQSDCVSCSLFCIRRPGLSSADSCGDWCVGGCLCGISASTKTIASRGQELLVVR